jgi:hypothetical protein
MGLARTPGCLADILQQVYSFGCGLLGHWLAAEVASSVGTLCLSKTALSVLRWNVDINQQSTDGLALWGANHRPFPVQPSRCVEGDRFHGDLSLWRRGHDTVFLWSS